MSVIFSSTHEAAAAAIELVLVQAPGRLRRLDALLEPESEHSHVLVQDGTETPRQFWLRGLRRARAIVGRGKRIRRLSYVMPPSPGEPQLPARVAKALGRTLAPGSTMVIVASNSSRPQVFDTMERVGSSLRGINVKAVFDDDGGERRSTQADLRA